MTGVGWLTVKSSTSVWIRVGIGVIGLSICSCRLGMLVVRGELMGMGVDLWKAGR